MTISSMPGSRSYQSVYEEFDSPLMSRLRSEAYGEDIGQHSWVTGDDLRRDVARLKLSGEGKLLDLGCGPCGPLTFIMKTVSCSGYGLDLSGAALAARARCEFDFGGCFVAARHYRDAMGGGEGIGIGLWRG